MSDTDDDYSPGYKKPPKHTQWKKGQSGNPSGKKKKSETLHQTLKRLADQEVVVQKNGIQMSMTQGEAMLTAVFSKAMKGDIACAKFLHGELGVDLPSGHGQGTTMQITEADIACLQSHADWLGIIEAAHADLTDDEGEADDADATE